MLLPILALLLSAVLIKLLGTATEDPEFLRVVRVGVVERHLEEEFCDGQFSGHLVRDRGDERRGADGDFGWRHCWAFDLLSASAVHGWESECLIGGVW